MPMAQPLRKRSENMSKKLICKIITDVLMLAAMPLLMAYMLVGEKLHEWLGIGIFILFILHHSLNYQWIKNLFRNKEESRTMYKQENRIKSAF